MAKAANALVKPGPSTESVHAGDSREASCASHALSPPIAQAATFAFASTAELAAFKEGRGPARDEYARYGNPTTRALETRLAALEKTEDAAAFASGMAALTTTLFALLRAGDHVVLFRDAYRQTRRFLTATLARFGVTCTLVEPGGAGLLALRPEADGGALRKSTKVVVVESPSNPYGHVVDFAALALALKPLRIRSIVDSTFATPILARPAEHGVDLVVHSATKYLSGHNDVLAGAVCGPSHLVGLVKEARDVFGSVLDPHAAFLVARGLKTLGLRVARQSASGLQIARMLEGHADVERVYYPGLPSHPDHAVAAAQMSAFGGVVSFVMKGGDAAARRLCDRVRIPRIAASLGGTESLIEPVALMSYAGSSEADLADAGIHPGLVRLAVGIEDEADLLADVAEALTI